MADHSDENPIQFYAEEIELPGFFNEELMRTWLNEIANQHNRNIGFLNYIFCDDEHLIEINRQYLNHDDYTDIITFPYRQDDILESDIFISLERVRDNASEFRTDFKKELLRVMAHGLLHLLGYQDKTDEDVLAMRNAEDEAILSYTNRKI